MKALGILPEYLHCLVLTDAMAASHCLNIVLRVPVGVINDRRVCSCEVDTYTSCLRGQQHRKRAVFVAFVFFCAKAIDRFLAVSTSHFARDDLNGQVSRLQILLLLYKRGLVRILGR